jgi:hypothetical protein
LASQCCSGSRLTAFVLASGNRARDASSSRSNGARFPPFIPGALVCHGIAQVRALTQRSTGHVRWARMSPRWEIPLGVGSLHRRVPTGAAQLVGSGVEVAVFPTPSSSANRQIAIPKEVMSLLGLSQGDRVFVLVDEASPRLMRVVPASLVSEWLTRGEAG